MARVISDECINCGTCVDWCLQEAIHEGPDHMEIDLYECVDCKLCEEKCLLDGDQSCFFANLAGKT